MSHSIGVAPGKISGIAEVRDADGVLKGTVEFFGETDLSEEELRQRLGLNSKGVDTHGSDPRNGGS